MADYYPVLSRAVVSLGEQASPEARLAIYDRARITLRGQLEASDPPLAPAHIERERAQLEAVIARLEIEARARQRPVSKPPLRYVEPPGGGAGEADDHHDEPEGALESAPDEPAALEAPVEAADESLSDPDPASRRPRFSFPSIEMRTVAIAAVAVVLIGTLATLAYALRDQVDPARREQAEQAAANPTPQPVAPQAKIAARLGPQGSQSAPPPPAATGTVGGGQVSQNDQALPVSQRAMMYLEVPGAADQVPRTIAGHVVWSFENLPGKSGQTPDPALIGVVEIPDAGLSLKLQMTRNHDTSLQASYLIGLVFSTKDQSVKEISPLLMKTDEKDRGVPLAGVQQPLGPNLFVIALSGANNDIVRNFDLLSKLGWMELQFRLADQRRGILVFEKGISGDRALLSATDAWK